MKAQSQNEVLSGYIHSAIPQVILAGETPALFSIIPKIFSNSISSVAFQYRE